ncbi:unnamed protein product [Kluyveromyces dobzhanskii CBS 2104]|uniref:WGS project CCBQ000000000 data, contig 00272 n=1 Tax=Kluyveromyces dobzhanskii CBS 2104 TaxID=1427455 RepID=A0A0A8LAU5_9SACH|nr:unnamed protein product [Kluyveromyces dobzhanskii CBS 2104]
MEEIDPLVKDTRSADDFSSKAKQHNSSKVNYEWADVSSVFKNINKDGQYKQYKPLSYVTNYIPTLNLPTSTIELINEHKEQNLENLKNYYHKEALASLASRKGSYVSQTSNSPQGIHSNRRCSLTHRFSSWNMDRLSEEQKSTNSQSGDNNVQTQASETAKVYLKYRQKFTSNGDVFSTTDIKESAENMWVPVARWNPEASDAEPKLYTSYKMKLSVPDSDSCPITITKLYPPIFSETKVPALTFHSIVSLNNCLYMLGGMSPCYSFSDVAPDLSSFHVDGIKHLPPPLDEAVINNPAILPSDKLYTYSQSSGKWFEARPTGQVPPALVCVQGSVLTDRHIFYYGGFEIKHEVSIDPKTNEYYIKKRAVLNDTAYILDTLCYKFTKIQLVAQPTKYVKFPNTVPRFGHLQVSLQTRQNKSPKSSSSEVDSTTSSSSASSSTTDKTSSTNTLEDPIMNFVSSSMTLNTDNIVSPTSSSTPGVYSILIMGGYRQGEDERFIPISDLWKVEITVLSRGKRNFLKFADTALVTIISKLPQHTVDQELQKEYYKKWPLPRGFMAFYITATDSLNPKSMDEDLLEKLMHQFKVSDSFYEKAAGKDSILPGRAAKAASTSKRLNKSLVIHGGSANDFIHGDMWCYDLDEGTWKKLPLKVKDNATGEIKEVDFPLTGHNFVHHKQLSVVIGGINQKDVDHSEYWKDCKNEGTRSNPTHSINGTFTFISLPSLVVKNFEVDNFCSFNRKYPEDMLLSALRLSCNPIVHDQDYIWTVGGLIKDTNTSSIFLRGAISIISLPLIDILGVNCTDSRRS